MNFEQIKKHYLIAIPTFRNPETISSIVKEVLSVGFELVVIDDGSPHKVSDILKQDQIDAPIIEHSQNLGKGAALRSAIQHARSKGFSHLVSIDADGQHSADDITPMINQSLLNPTAMILGKRDFKNSDGKTPFSSVFGRLFSDFWVFIETFKLVTDSQSGFRVYPVKKLQEDGCKCTAYDFEIEVLVRYLWAGGSTSSLPIKVIYPVDRVSSFKAFKDNLRFTKLHTKLCTQRVLGYGWLHHKGSKELSGAKFTDFIIRFFGPKLCFKLVPLISLFYWFLIPSARSSMHDFYQRLCKFQQHRHSRGLMGFKNIHQFALGIFDRIAYSSTKVLPTINSTAIKYNPGSQSWTILSAHFGDWTFSGIAFTKIHNKKSLIVMDQKLSPKLMELIQSSFGDLVNLVGNEVGGVELILKCRQMQEEGGFVCLMADRNPMALQMKDPITVSFLGSSLTISASVFKLSLLLGKPIYFFANRRKDLSYSSDYIIECKELWNSIELLTADELAKRYFKTLEEVVSKDPSQWFNFTYYWGKHGSV